LRDAEFGGEGDLEGGLLDGGGFGDLAQGDADE